MWAGVRVDGSRLNRHFPPSIRGFGGRCFDILIRRRGIESSHFRAGIVVTLRLHHIA